MNIRWNRDLDPQRIQIGTRKWIGNFRKPDGSRQHLETGNPSHKLWTDEPLTVVIGVNNHCRKRACLPSSNQRWWQIPDSFDDVPSYKPPFTMDVPWFSYRFPWFSPCDRWRPHPARHHNEHRIMMWSAAENWSLSMAIPKSSKDHDWLVVWNHGIRNDFPFSWEGSSSQLMKSIIFQRVGIRPTSVLKLHHGFFRD